MKIDIHCHTKKVKSGDKETRNVTADMFSEIILNTNVKILAITNHNHFDLKQYYELRKSVEGTCQVWPGIEIDVKQSTDNSRSHLLIICNPKSVQLFNQKILSLIPNGEEENYIIEIENISNHFDSLDCIYIAHYLNKSPSLSDESIGELENNLSDKTRMLKETTNAVSAGIFINHGHKSIYGSDVSDWREYKDLSKDLPELKLPVDSFEQFCLLLKKDISTIKTILDKKQSREIEINPFNDKSIKLTIYNDVNIIFGSKGTGKSDILSAISKDYNDKGYQTNVYISSDKDLQKEYDIKGKAIDIDESLLKIDECVKEFDFIKHVSEINLTNITSYKKYFSNEITNKKAKGLSIYKYLLDQNQYYKNQSIKTKQTMDKIEKFIDFINCDSIIQKYIENDQENILKNTLNSLVLSVKGEHEINIIATNSLNLFNMTVKKFNDEIAKKTGNYSRPTETGFLEYANNRIMIEKSCKKILDNIHEKKYLNEIKVGSLGEKGDIYLFTEFKVQDGNFTDSKWRCLKNLKKSDQKIVIKKINNIYNSVYKSDLFEKLREFNDLDNLDYMCRISDLIQFSRYFAVDNSPYKPSTGESSMILLHNELKEEKDVYILDEPEKSLGNEYINNVIVPLIKEKAAQGKTIIIATHDANIAVRTLPYNSIYRIHNNGDYRTYVGNPFTNNLIDIEKNQIKKDWKNVSMKTLEGGRNAFGERGIIYGE